MDYVVALSDLPAHLRERVPDVRGQWLVTDGAPLAGCLLGRLASGELVYLVDYVGDDGEGIAQYAGWAIVSDRPPAAEIGLDADLCIALRMEVGASLDSLRWALRPELYASHPDAYSAIASAIAAQSRVLDALTTALGGEEAALAAERDVVGAADRERLQEVRDMSPEQWVSFRDSEEGSDWLTYGGKR